MFDGDDILPGDRLYDLIDGIMTVRQVYKDAIVCTYNTRNGRKATRTYNYRGVPSNRSVKTLYWQDIRNIVIPRKSAAAWASQKALIKASTDAIGKLAVDQLLPLQDEDTSNITLAEAQHRGLIDEPELAQLEADGVLVSEEIITHEPEIPA